MACNATLVYFCDMRVKRTQKRHPLSGDSEHAVYDSLGTRYPSLVHYVVAQKHAGSPTWIHGILAAERPRMALLHADSNPTLYNRAWEEARDAIALDGIRYKAQRHRDVYDAFLSTGLSPIIAIDDDAYWGVGRDGLGRNAFGRMLEIVRSEIVEGKIQRPPMFYPAADASSRC